VCRMMKLKSDRFLMKIRDERDRIPAQPRRREVEAT